MTRTGVGPAAAVVAVLAHRRLANHRPVAAGAAHEAAKGVVVLALRLASALRVQEPRLHRVEQLLGDNRRRCVGDLDPLGLVPQLDDAAALPADGDLAGGRVFVRLKMVRPAYPGLRSMFRTVQVDHVPPA